MGDPAGIGTEIAIKAWAGRARNLIAPFVFYGDPALIEARARLLSLSVHVEPIADPAAAREVFSSAIPVVTIPLVKPSRPGEPDPDNAPAVIASIDQAVHDVAQGRARAVVTSPIAKSVLYAAGFSHPGHTEYLAHLASRHWPGRTFHPVMMLACPDLRVVPVTIHVPLKDVPGLLTQKLLRETIRITWDSLRHQFGIAAPRIAVTGLNPHAGEGGSIGSEDANVIAPVVRAFRDEGLMVTGPHPADTLFHASARQTYDAAVCMYHDQALIPIKTLAFDEGVNLTLGLPFVRTSPDHGTAFDIAAHGLANPASLIEALKLADTLSASRAQAAAGP
jgi:4-hydroxythreonine-4-phosphate dehydrogenase